jgi:hypothetical protein
VAPVFSALGSCRSWPQRGHDVRVLTRRVWGVLDNQADGRTTWSDWLARRSAADGVLDGGEQVVLGEPLVGGDLGEALPALEHARPIGQAVAG